MVQKYLPFVITAVVVVAVVGLLVLMRPKPEIVPAPISTTIRYVAMGDSYTSGEGAEADEAWPVVLTRHLQRDGIDIELVANTARTGAPTEDVIIRQLPLLKEQRPTFVTLLIGVNDIVQQVPFGTFKTQYQTILDRVLAIVGDPQRVVLITIPDLTAAPAGKNISNSLNLTRVVPDFNRLIMGEGQKRTLAVIDIFSLSQEMGTKPDLVAADGLHPSAKEYAQWEQLIYQTVRQLFIQESTPNASAREIFK